MLAAYRSWGTEKVYVDRDEPGRISLVHILEMRVVDQDMKDDDTPMTMESHITAKRVAEACKAT